MRVRRTFIATGIASFVLALEAMEELKDYELLDSAVKYLSSRSVRSKHKELLGTTSAEDMMIERCEWSQ